MAKFDIEKNGYCVSQVDEYIDKLVLKYENRLNEQKNRISALLSENLILENNLKEIKIREDEVERALLFAVERSEQVEKSSNKIFELEVRRIRLMYTRWQEIMDMLDSDSLMEIKNGKFGVSIQEFENDLTRIIEQNENMERKDDDDSIKDDLKKNSGNYIKNLLNRMDYLVTNSYASSTKAAKQSDKVVDAMKDDTKKENARLLNINRRFNNITNKLGLATASVLSDDNLPENNAYFKNITGQVGDDEAFDMEAILNPKEDLDEIMKAFDLLDN